MHWHRTCFNDLYIILYQGESFRMIYYFRPNIIYIPIVSGKQISKAIRFIIAKKPKCGSSLTSYPISKNNNSLGFKVYPPKKTHAILPLTQHIKFSNSLIKGIQSLPINILLEGTAHLPFLPPHHSVTSVPFQALKESFSERNDYANCTCS